MISPELLPFLLLIFFLYFFVAVFSVFSVQRIKKTLQEKDRDAKRRMYELAILKEVSDRTSYSLDIKKILDVISGSLKQFLEYSTVGYMVLGPDKVLFKLDLDRAVAPSFVVELKKYMLDALSVLIKKELKNVPVEEVMTGAIMLDTLEEPVRSYFNIPVVIQGETVAVFTVAHTKPDFYKKEEKEILEKIILHASQEITKLEEVIRTEQGKVAAMLESMIEGVIMTDRDYRIVAANPAAKAIIAYKGTEHLPTIFDFIEGFKGVFDIKAKLEEAIKLDKMITIESIVLGGKYYQILISPVKSSSELMNGAILGGAIIFHDITHEKEAEKMRSDFTSMMVHELRSPLGNIKKIGELMKSPKTLEDKATSQEYISMLYDSSSLMLDLVNDLLDVARLEAGKFEVAKNAENIRDLIADRVKFFTGPAQTASIALRSFVDPAVPLSIYFDSKRIVQVVNNILSNALKYTPKDGTVTVLCFLHKKGETFDKRAEVLGAPWVPVVENSATRDSRDSVVIAVTDTGEGITPENIKKLWNKFTQFESSIKQADHRGTGLGLVIVKGIIELHHGVVGVGSTKGIGSTFYFTLPL